MDAGSEDRTIASLTAREQLLLQQLSQLSYWQQQGRRSSEAGALRSSISARVEERLPERWNLLRNVSLYPWQQRAADAWLRAGCRGIIKVVTGAGKTMLALGIIEQLQHTNCPDLRVAIVVPTVVLMDQWKDTFASYGNLPPGAIATLGGSAGEGFGPDTRIVIAVINSAASKLPDSVKRAGIGDRLLLVVDECHRAGAAERRRLFETPRAYSIGLSATPERDDRTAEDLAPSEVNEQEEQAIAGDEVLSSELGPIVYEMNYADAVRDGVLAPFVVEHYGISLAPNERNRYENLSREITDLRRTLETRTRRGIALIRWCRSASGQKDARARRFISLTNERKLLLYRLDARLQAVREIIRRAFVAYKNPRIIIFHESIDDVMLIFDSLRRLSLPVVAEHSEFPDKMRSESIRLFRDGAAQIIVSARSLIEGFNVPSADIGIVAAASGSVRQRIQTLGRLLRPNPGKDKRARLIVLYASRTVDEMIYEKADWEAFIGADRNEYYLWPDIERGEPQPVADPPRRPPVTDADVNVESLIPGAAYPGMFEGKIYGVDTQGNVTDDAGSLYEPTPSLRRILKQFMRGGGRFAVTPTRHFLLKMQRDEKSSAPVFLGVAPEPLFRDADTARSNGPFEGDSRLGVGSVYPFSVAGAKRFSVLQRDSRLIAKKGAGGIKFVVPPEKVPDVAKAALLREIIGELRGVYRSGRQISKIFVTLSGDVVYSHDGRYHFVGKAPEGQDGFAFE